MTQCPRVPALALLAALGIAACDQPTAMPMAESAVELEVSTSPTSALNPLAILTPPTHVDDSGILAASMIGQPVPASVIVVHNGLEWVWASPCALNGCTAGIDVGHDDFRFATVAEWALRPSADQFRNPDKCASPWFDFTHNHCDWADASQATDDNFHNCCSLSTYGSAPAGEGGPTGGYGDPMHPVAETWLVRGQVDNTPPTIAFELSTTELWPPNHMMQTVAVGISASDDVDPSPTVEVAVVSDELADGTGDGDTSPDWLVIDNGDGTFDVQLRAERAGNGDGRVYTITVTATDAAGNSASASGDVTVPHSKGRR